MGESPFSSAHFEVRIDGGRGRRSRELGLCFVGPISSEDRAEDPGAGRPRPGHAPIVLRRALSEDRYLFEWRQASAAGDPDRRTLSLRVFSGGERERSIELHLTGCRPTRWTGPRLDAVAGGVALEELELEYDELIWVQ